MDPDIEIRELHHADAMAAVSTVFQQVWGTVTPLVDAHLLRAIAHSGGYVAGAYEHGNIVGASFGFLGRHRDELALHSHVTGILPGVQHGGVGRAIKEHQRTWARDHDIGWITWTFDPLVRRNAHFNIEVLGAHVSEYLVNYYGQMSDSINASDDSDRLMVAWSTSDDVRPAVTDDGDGETILVATPEDVVKLRRTDPAEAFEWRLRVREQLGGAMDRGSITGFNRNGEYVVTVAG